jgi:hypothetical protein
MLPSAYISAVDLSRWSRNLEIHCLRGRDLKRAYEEDEGNYRSQL